MPKIQYKEQRFSADSLALIEAAEAVIDDYQAQGLLLTLRQLYYRLVAAGQLPNSVKSYKRLGGVVGDARLAGLLDWSAIEDRGRNRLSVTHWTSPSEIIDAAARGYTLDKWAGQENRVEVWVEKQALESVVWAASEPLDVPAFACKGYVSLSELWAAARRFREHVVDGQTPVIIHLGDHDPSGIDMTRDLQERLETFGVADIIVDRIALNMNQVEAYRPPPNPAKMTDSRFAGYADRFGTSSWELDALDPATLHALIQKRIRYYLTDKPTYEAIRVEEDRERRRLQEVARRWEEIAPRMADTTKGDAGGRKKRRKR